MTKEPNDLLAEAQIPTLQTVHGFISEYRRVGRELNGIVVKKKISERDLDDFIFATRVSRQHGFAPHEYIEAISLWHEQKEPGKFVPPHQLHSEHALQVAINTGRRAITPAIKAQRQLRLNCYVKPDDDGTYYRSYQNLKQDDSPETFDFDLEYVYHKQINFKGEADTWIQKLYEDFQTQAAMADL
ncbi:MAG: hypothetical protein K2Q26_02720 [Bdellovibrionales bacterium]|nr:hypothetical protein [Bdellovibrionales bacterium]